MTHPLSPELRQLANDPRFNAVKNTLHQAADSLDIGAFHRDAAIKDCEKLRSERDNLKRKLDSCKELSQVRFDQAIQWQQERDEAIKARDTWKAVALERQSIKADYARLETERDELRASCAQLERERGEYRNCYHDKIIECDELRQLCAFWETDSKASCDVLRMSQARIVMLREALETYANYDDASGRLARQALADDEGK